ncbi:MAG: N-acetyltransferase [Nitrospirota bacterium]|nr:N-acetyltransferase [Nitrospirota bacterium]
MHTFEVKAAKDLDRFIELPFSLYKNYPHYVPQLRKELRDQFSQKNPFFLHAAVKYFLAEKEGRIVGRICSIINDRHREFQQEDAGFFGFFESENDCDVAKALLDVVSADLKAAGMKDMRGPMNFSTNEECGFLIEGYDEYPMIMTPYNPPYYNDLMEQCGMRKAKDLHAYIYDMQEAPPEKVLRVAAIAEKRGITVRPIDKRNFGAEMMVFKEVYNAAWEKNWGFIPLTDEELLYLGERLRQIVVPELTLIAEHEGKPVGFLGMVPDFNVVLKQMKGSLNPLSILKALYYSRKIRGLRLLLLGITREFRNKGVDAVLLREIYPAMLKGKYQRVEFSWILEDNVPIQRIVEMAGGRLYKKYRLYEKVL